MYNELSDRSPGYIEETFESAGCTGQCPTYPGAPMTEDGCPDCSKCPQQEYQDNEDLKNTDEDYLVAQDHLESQLDGIGFEFG